MVKPVVTTNTCLKSQMQKTYKPNILLSSLLYLEDISEGLPGQLVVDDGEEFAERPQEGGGLHTLPQQVLHCGQDVDFRLLK